VETPGGGGGRGDFRGGGGGGGPPPKGWLGLRGFRRLGEGFLFGGGKWGDQRGGTEVLAHPRPAEFRRPHTGGGGTGGGAPKNGGPAPGPLGLTFGLRGGGGPVGGGR